jgi:hypothetical protein
MLSFHLRLGLPIGLFPAGFSTKQTDKGYLNDKVPWTFTKLRGRINEGG